MGVIEANIGDADGEIRCRCWVGNVVGNADVWSGGGGNEGGLEE